MADVIAKVRGLYTNPSSRVTAAEGGLTEAVNVVFERNGSATPRPGFRLASYTYASKDAARFHPWEGTTSALRINTDGTCSWLSSPSSLITLDGADSDLFSGPMSISGVASARNNLYVAGAYLGVRKLTSPSDTIASACGLHQMPSVLYIDDNGTSGGWLADDYATAYRVCSVRKDPNGLIVRGPAIGHYRFRNTTGTTIALAVTVVIPNDAEVGDVIEIYRAEQSALDVEPDDDYYLAGTAEVGSADVTNGYVIFYDTVADNDLGAACYTNDSREGVESANFAPPMAAFAETFNGSLFCALPAYPSRFTIRWDEGNDRSGSATGVGIRSYSGTRTNGSNTLTAMASTTGLKVGMIIAGAGTWSVTPCIITAINSGAGTVTMSGTLSTATTTATVSFYDSIRIGDEYHMAYSAASLMASLRGLEAILPGVTVASEKYHAYCISGRYGKADDASILGVQNIAVVIEEREANQDTSSIYATHGSEYTPALPEPNASADPDVAMAYEVMYNRLIFSKNNEPEHMPIGYYVDVGDSLLPIYAIRSTRDSLWIFKLDGVWRLTGSAAPRWNVDLVDATVRILHPSAITRCGGSIFMFTNRGVYECSDERFASVSGPIDDKLESITRALVQNITTFADSVWMASDPVAGNVLLGFGSAYDSTYAEFIYCFNVGTREWSEWSFDWTIVEES